MKTSAFHLSLFHINNWWKIVGALGGSVCLANTIKHNKNQLFVRKFCFRIIKIFFPVLFSFSLSYIRFKVALICFPGLSWIKRQDWYWFVYVINVVSIDMLIYQLLLKWKECFCWCVSCILIWRSGKINWNNQFFL